MAVAHVLYILVVRCQAIVTIVPSASVWSMASDQRRMIRAENIRVGASLSGQL